MSSPKPVHASTRRPSVAELRAVIEPLAAIERLPTSPGEREAAHRIADLLGKYGADARVEEEPAYGGYPRTIGLLSAIGVLGGVLGGRSRLLGAAVGAVAALGVADDISYRQQSARKALGGKQGTAYNVVATVGAEDAAHTLVVMAHHDAAPTGFVFDQRLARWYAKRYPEKVEKATENPPMWLPALVGPALVAVGSLTGSKKVRRTGIAFSAITAASMLQLGRSGAVPGANDNLSGVAVLVALAKSLQENPVPDLRVVLLSAGAEEALQEGIRGFAARHFPQLPKERTHFLNFDTVASGHLVLLEGEGPLKMEEYDAGFKDLLARCATEQGVRLDRGLSSRSSTDGVVPNRAGYPTATVVSVDDEKQIPHYHLHTDLPENLDYECVADAAVLAESAARKLA